MLVRRDLIAACTFLLFKGPQTKSRHSRGERGGEGSDGDAHRLALGCKLHILVSLRVFEMERHYICPIQVSLGTLRKDNYKKCRH